MPGFDRTGPLSWGSMTGRGLGPCGRGARRGGAGLGRGWGRSFTLTGPSYPEGDEVSHLKAGAASLAETLEQLNRRISELERSSGEER